jgi:hypothetical protein
MIKFEPGTILSTKAAMNIVLKAKVAGKTYIQRHLKGDFGDIDYQLKKQNKVNMDIKKGKIESEYLLPNGSKLGIVTDFEKVVTIFYKPGEDYSYLAENKKLLDDNETNLCSSENHDIIESTIE